ncbi:protein-disulfide reductase DsbD domain-containing protein [Granulicella cerasi]|uniref:Protein-disulfide reductase DsbD domain-containing protein n=1 Tax=Granulicella cerasi TaxID=741063 RepID=A0ABW1Z5T1_9BACT
MNTRPYRLLQSLLLAFACMFFAVSATAQIQEVGDGTAGPFKAEHLTAELVTLSPQVAAGDHVTIGLLLTLEEKWHVYWVNAGDSGEPPSVKWTLPKGITAGPMQFPPPQRLPLGPFMDYGYEDQVAFPIQIDAAQTLKPGKVHLDAHVNWIVCSDRCIPGKAHLGLDLNIVKGPLPAPPVVGALGQAIGWLPKPLPADEKLMAVYDGKMLALTLTGDDRETDAEFYPFDKEVIANAADQIVEPLDDGVRLRLERAEDLDHAGQYAPCPPCSTAC